MAVPRWKIKVVRRAAKRHGIAPRTLYGVWGAETNFGQHPTRVSSAGARGDFQFMPATARSYGIDPWNFREAANAAALYLSRSKKAGKGFARILSDYNAGPAGAIQPDYVAAVKRAAAQWPQARSRLGDEANAAVARASGSQGPLKALVAGGTARTPVAGTAPQEPAFSARTALALPELAGDVPSSDVPGRERTSELARLLRSTPTTPPVPVGLPRVVEPGGGGRPSPLNPARFQVGRSGRRAVQRTGRREGEVLVWRGGRWVYARGGGPVRKLRWRPEGGTNRSALGAPVDRPGVPTAAVVRRFVERLADAAEFPITYGTGSRHSRLTASGNVSDHWVGRGIDLPLRGRQLRIAGTKALRILGVPRAQARRMAFRGGIFNIRRRGRRHQVIVRAPDHWDHLHWGISR